MRSEYQLEIVSRLVKLIADRKKLIPQKIVRLVFRKALKNPFSEIEIKGVRGYDLCRTECINARYFGKYSLRLHSRVVD